MSFAGGVEIRPRNRAEQFAGIEIFRFDMGAEERLFVEIGYLTRYAAGADSLAGSRVEETDTGDIVWFESVSFAGTVAAVKGIHRRPALRWSIQRCVFKPNDMADLVDGHGFEIDEVAAGCALCTRGKAKVSTIKYDIGIADFTGEGVRIDTRDGDNSGTARGMELAACLVEVDQIDLVVL